ncbi:major facilitator superfamily MFS_1 [Plesiocystis pacifica SIR-1]|uniref:Major facilitator superfamily MFS_1 n=1 Tax=Plesiocystis pacifica SIR-1 TaxID=391625 RepID=A6FZ25_9BACT|nr:MFS transporter [Plesiocystis pacifica]EDM81180.1 major facilitator superfamily MFS_1 [Plesiocystis pacifica SIR-1]
MAEAVDSARARRVFAVVCVGVLFATSTWFSGTAAARQLAAQWSLSPGQSAALTSSTQWGFIAGTLLYSLTNLADRFDAREVFFASALAGALANLGFAWLSSGLSAALVFRFATGVTLAGVYPVGMKLIAGWYREGLGWRLGVMVGCLTLGTAFPHGVLALELGGSFDWRTLATTASVASCVGGLAVLAWGHERPRPSTEGAKAGAKLDLRMVVRVFQDAPFRRAALGYFGHMWELYAFWSLVSYFLVARSQTESGASLEPWIPTLAFALVAVGSLGCVLGGLLSRRIGERRVALLALTGSGLACASSGWAFALPPGLLVAFLGAWGLLVVADSPQFSALAARHAPPDYVGTALTIQNGLGYLLTTVSIQLLPALAGHIGWRWAFTVLAIGPALGVLATARLPED